MNLSGTVMRARISFAYAVVALSLACARAGAGGACDRGLSWWDRARGACVPCTRCDPNLRLAVLYPCEVHRDTVCQSLYNVRIWPFNTQSKNSSDERDQELVQSDDEYYDYVEYDSDNESVGDADAWDLQTTSLVLAVSGCFVFFLVVLVLSLYHAKQWRILKQALMSDVQDLTAKLKLMESGSDVPAEPVVATDHHIYCNIHAGKESLLGPSSNKKGRGNVYTQEKHPS